MSTPEDALETMHEAALLLLSTGSVDPLAVKLAEQVAAYVEVHASSGPATGEALSLSRIEDRARSLLAQLAPPGTVVTPALIDSVKKQVLDLIVEELRAGGMSEPAAKVLAGFMAIAINVKGKT